MSKLRPVFSADLEFNEKNMKFLTKTLKMHKNLKVGVLNNPNARKRSGSIAGGIGGFRYRKDPKVTVQAVAYWHEMGLVPGAPQRAFLRPTFYNNKKTINIAVRRMLRNAFVRRNLNIVTADLTRLGVFLLQSLRKHYLQGEQWPPLSPNTRPGAPIRMPMLDSWQIISSFGFKVDDFEGPGSQTASTNSTAIKGDNTRYIKGS